MSERHVTMAANGRVIIPAHVRNELGMSHGGSFVLHVHNGELRLEPTAHAIARVQALVEQYVPAYVSLADELSAERRVAAERE